MLAESKLISIEERTKFLYKCFIRKTIRDEKSLTNEILKKYYFSLKRNSKKKGKCVLLNSCLLEIFENENPDQNRYDLFVYDYKTITTSIPVEFFPSKSLQQHPNPNSVINDLLEKHNASAIHIH